jgi:hypothetical protein
MIGGSSQGIESKLVADKNADRQEVGNRDCYNSIVSLKTRHSGPDAEALLNANAEGSRARRSSP